MNIDTAFQGSLFASDFLCDAITRSLDWQELDDASLEDLEAALRAICDRFPAAVAPNESQTEDDLIWPVLARLGWTASLRQQNLSAYGRVDVPDGLLFADEAAKGQANGFAEEWRRYELGLAVVESKRWQRPLDRRSGRAGEETAPSTQMLRYLRRDRRSDHRQRSAGAFLPTAHGGGSTTRARGRSPNSSSRSISLRVLDLPGHNDGLFALTEAERRHCAQGVRAGLPARGLPAGRSRRAHLPSARHRRRPLLRTARRRQSVQAGLRPGFSRARACDCRRRAGRAPAGGARGRPAPALPAALHPLRRGPRPAARPR